MPRLLDDLESDAIRNECQNLEDQEHRHELVDVHDGSWLASAEDEEPCSEGDGKGHRKGDVDVGQRRISRAEVVVRVLEDRIEAERDVRDGGAASVEDEAVEAPGLRRDGVLKLHDAFVAPGRGITQVDHDVVLAEAVEHAALGVLFRLFDLLLGAALAGRVHHQQSYPVVAQALGTQVLGVVGFRTRKHVSIRLGQDGKVLDL
mmetsp:Transcript_12121/g.44970  ORF Transcript_12121/g.44970 Transcript_12121/m.44970 type:complete len:204 (+) Transcript_12121:728-1339(+)